MKTLKKTLAVLLCMAMVLAMSACSDSTSGNNDTTAAAGTTEAAQQGGDTTTAAPAVEYPPVVEGPIEITFWHTRGSGANLENLTEAVEEFNSTNEYGITVNAEYIGSYGETLAKCSTALVSGDNPVLMVVAEGGLGQLGLANQYQDLTPYAERDGFDLSDIPASLQNTMWADTDNDGVEELVGMPYVRSSSVASHNTALFEEIGVSADEIPNTIEELIPLWKEIYEKTGKYGLCLLSDPFYFQCGLLQSMAVSQFGVTNGGALSTDGVSADCLEDGTMLQLLTDWSSWCEEGWCWRFSTTDASATQLEMFYRGEVATIFHSCGNLGNIIKNIEESENIDIEDWVVRDQPGYGGPGGRLGGGSLIIIPENHTEQEIDAAWQFIKFAMSAEQTAKNAVQSGYLCTTYSGLKDPDLIAAFDKYPQYWAAHEAMENSYDASFTRNGTSWYTQIKNVFSAVITDGTMTPEQGVQTLKDVVSQYLYPQS